jgi:dethiobiotin synthase
MHRYRTLAALRYWKPIQTGIDRDDDTAEVGRLGDCRREELFSAGVRLPNPVSPHLAAHLSGTTIDIQPLVDTLHDSSAEVRWIVEGAGGALVPINATALMADFMCKLGLATVVVARATLGTINHTLLTLEALRHRRLYVAGVVMVGDRDAENRAAIERYGHVVVLGEMPRFDRLTAAVIRSWAGSGLDCEGRLLELLR